MTVLAYTAQELTMWRITLGIGAVVIAVVILLLSFLVKIVKDIDSGVADVLNAAAGVRAIELATRPITPILGSIAGDLAATQKALEDLLASKASQARSRPVMVSRLRQRGA